MRSACSAPYRSPPHSLESYLPFTCAGLVNCRPRTGLPTAHRPGSSANLAWSRRDADGAMGPSRTNDSRLGQIRLTLDDPHHLASE